MIPSPSLNAHNRLVKSPFELLGTDGTTVLEADLNDGSFNASSSSIAGATLPATGTFFLRVRHNTATGTIRPYHLHVRVQSGAPVAEVEANNTPATATPLPASGWVSGSVDPVADADFYSLTLAAGDSDRVAQCLSDRWLADTTLFGSATKVRDGIEAWFDAGIRTPIIVPSSVRGNQLAAIDEFFAIWK